MSSRFSKFRAVGISAIVLGLSACATSLTSTIDTADNVDLSAFKTYAWVSDQTYRDTDAQSSELSNPVNHSRIRFSIDQELQDKGYTKVPLADADLAVSYTLGARDKVTIRNYYDDFGYRYYGYYGGFSRFGRGFNRFGPGLGGFGTTTTVRTVTEGTLVVDLFDNKRMEAIWHGTASKRISGDNGGRQLVSEAVDTLLGEFPDSKMVAEVMQEMVNKDVSS